MRPRLVRALALVTSPLLFVAVSSAGVRILGQPGAYATIQAAVDAAVDGDVLLVEDGTYPAFRIDDKALTVLAPNPGLAKVQGQCTVAGLASTREVALIGLEIRADDEYPMPPCGLRLEGCDGAVRVQGCSLYGGLDYSSSYLYVGHGLLATDCKRVLIVQSLLRGHDAGYFSGYYPVPPGDGLNTVNSGSVVYASQLTGGVGSEETNPSGGTGGSGARVQGWGLFAAGTTFTGRNGGGGDYIGCTTSGDGGDGLTITDGQVQWLDDVFTAGLAGNFATCGLGSPGQTIRATNAVVHQIPGQARDLTGPVLTTDKTSTYFQVSGQSGDSVWLLASPRGGWLFLLTLSGLATTPYPWRIPIAPPGTIGAGGTVTLPLTLPDLTGPEAGWIWDVQAICVEPGGRNLLTTPLQVLVLNT